MKLIIAGSRTYDNYNELAETMSWPWADGITEVVCGGARGADRLGEHWAHNNRIPVKMFKADWDKYGVAAGCIRNVAMADYADKLVAFWDGRSKGTKHMINTMEKRNKPVKIVLFS